MSSSINQGYAVCKETCDDGSIYNQWIDGEVSSLESIEGLSLLPDNDDEFVESKNVATFIHHDENLFQRRVNFFGVRVTKSFFQGMRQFYWNLPPF